MNRTQKLFLISAIAGLITGIILKTFLRSGYVPSDTAPQRIISIGPNITEIIYALGQQHKLVGVDDFSRYPSPAELIPRVGGVINPNLEKIISLQPDIVFLSGNSQKIKEFCNDHSIQCIGYEFTDLKSVFYSIQDMGKLMDAQSQADTLLNLLKASFDSIQLSSISRDITVLTVIPYQQDLTKFMTTSGNSFIGEIIELAGGENVIGNQAVIFPEISQEAVLLSDPQLILILASPLSPDSADSADLVKQWIDLYPQSTATKNNQIYILSDDYLLIPGPRIILIAQRIDEIFENYSKH
ncbi:MAG: hypothetical protein APR63_01170 [Desulfuromonas sp. SDB]|nr:MAG: hypothetical protein APR63_01170 [Desulfuromonas sp. SDB]